MARKATATDSLGKSGTQQSLFLSGPTQGIRARNEWLHRIIGANERITEVVVVAAVVAIIIFKEANE